MAPLPYLSSISHWTELMQTIAHPFSVWKRTDLLVWFVLCPSPPSPNCRYWCPAIVSPCPGGGVVCGKIGEPLRCLMVFYWFTQDSPAPFTLCYAVQAFQIGCICRGSYCWDCYSVLQMHKHTFSFHVWLINADKRKCCGLTASQMKALLLNISLIAVFVILTNKQPPSFFITNNLSIQQWQEYFEKHQNKYLLFRVI